MHQPYREYLDTTQSLLFENESSIKALQNLIETYGPNCRLTENLAALKHQRTRLKNKEAVFMHRLQTEES